MEKKILLIVSIVVMMGSMGSAQTFERVSFQSAAGGNDSFQPVVGAPFSVTASGSGGSLTITSEYGENDFHDEIPQTVADGYIPVADGISLFPNPTDYIVNIAVSNAAELGYFASVEVYDMGGRLMLSQNIGEGEFSLDVSALKAGNYLIRIGKTSAKMVKM